MQLVIAEKPSVAMSIASVIGADKRKTENWACVTYHRARKMLQKGMEADENEK